MAVSLPNEHVIEFYASPNLKQWIKVGAFGPAGATGGHVVNGKVEIRLLLDASSLEVFAQRDETVLTDLVFLSPGPRRLSLATHVASPRVRSIVVNPLAAVR